MSNKDTFDAKFHGTFVVKPNSRSSLKGAGAVIACFLGGQIALGAPAAKTRSNGEVLFCENLAMADAAARKALNGTTILKQVTTELTERVQAKLIQAGLLRDGGTVAAITERELRANTRAQLCALAATLAARGFACMAGGQLILFLAANDSMVEGEVTKMPRSLGDKVHGLESQQPALWARFRRFTPGQKVPTTSELVEAVKKERDKNAAKGRKVIKEAHSNVKSGKATEREKTIVKNMADGRADGRKTFKEAHSNVKSGKATEREKTIVKKMADGRNRVKDARTHVKNGTASQKEKTIVENIKKGAESKGVNGGYVVLDQHDLIERNARLNTFKTKPTFNIVVTRGNTFYISNGTKELQIGSIHTNKGRKFRVLRKLA